MDKETKEYLVKKLKAMRKKVSKFSKSDWKEFYKQNIKDNKNAK